MITPHLRLTTRRMMIAVALTAVAMGLFLMRRRSLEFQHRAHYHAMMTTIASVTGAESKVGRADAEELARLTRELSAFHDDMRQRYERAARRPWESVASDQFDPELGGVNHGYWIFGISYRPGLKMSDRPAEERRFRRHL